MKNRNTTTLHVSGGERGELEPGCARGGARTSELTDGLLGVGEEAEEDEQAEEGDSQPGDNLGGGARRNERQGARDGQLVAHLVQLPSPHVGVVVFEQAANGHLHIVPAHIVLLPQLKPCVAQRHSFGAHPPQQPLQLLIPSKPM